MLETDETDFAVTMLNEDLMTGNAWKPISGRAGGLFCQAWCCGKDDSIVLNA
ncbi:hypothetical protein N826_09110 [Skermanella aerolata KACC 11604]|nr:hypothetical protein N826_09110 [Skermanella aerolata KACC 11604]